MWSLERECLTVIVELLKIYKTVSHDLYPKIDDFGDTEPTRRAKFSGVKKTKKKKKFSSYLLDYALLFLSCSIFAGTRRFWRNATFWIALFPEIEKATAYALF